MKPPIRIATALILSSVLVLPLLSAQEVPRALYSVPFGVTEADALRVLIAPAPLRLQGPASICNAEVTVDYLDAGDLTLLFTSGPTPLGIGNSFQSDFTPQVGGAPTRQEIVIKATIERTQPQSAEEETLAAICPLRGSVEMYDVATGDSLAVFIESTLGFEALNWNGFDEVTLRQ